MKSSHYVAMLAPEEWLWSTVEDMETGEVTYSIHRGATAPDPVAVDVYRREDAVLIAQAPRLRAMVQKLRDAAVNTPALDSSKDWTALIEEADQLMQKAGGAS